MNPTATPIPHVPPANRRILVVDDNPAIHSDIRKILCPKRSEDNTVGDLEDILFDETPPVHEMLSFELHSAYQGEEALEMVRRSLAESRPYALAFVDVRMPPGWDGIETISRIWELDPALQMVICTAYSDYSWEEMRTKLGQPESLVVLKKPFDNVEVQQLAHALTRKWQLNLQAETATRQLESVIDYMRSLLEMQKRLSDVPISRSGDIRGPTWEPADRSAEPHPSPSDSLAPPSPPVSPGEPETREPLAEVLMRLKQTLEHTFRQLRDTEVQLVQADKMASLGRLSAGIMHEINNPLNYTLTAVDLSGRYAELMPEPARQEYLENRHDLKEGLLRISKIVQDLREFAGPQFRAIHSIEVSHCLDTALRILTAELPKEINVVNQVPKHFTVQAVSSRLTQVFLNLIHNSVDALRDKVFTPGTRPEIHFEASTENGVKIVRIRDNGPGIPAPDLDRIFDPFFTTKEAGRGTGLGLSICYRLLRDVGAGIRVRSEPGVFCEFILAFPGESQAIPESFLHPNGTAAAAP